MFGVKMGYHDGVENCDVVGLYFSNWLSTVLDNSPVYLTKNYGFAAINNGNSQKHDRITEGIIQLF